MSHAAAVAVAVAADVAADVAVDVAADVAAAVAGASAMLAAAVTHAATSAAAVNLTQPPSRIATEHSAAAAGLTRALMPCQHQQRSHWVM